MFIAHNINHEIVHIDDIEQEEVKTFFCPCCGTSLIVKDGKINAKHFAHRSLADCDTFTQDLSDWHKSMQMLFDKEQREVVISYKSVKHRADVVFRKFVIEFQHTHISAEEFNERNNFYVSAGYRVIWIFDKVYEYDTGQIMLYRDTVNGAIFKYSYAMKTLALHNHSLTDNKVFVYLHLYDNDIHDVDEIILERINWAPKADNYDGYNLKYFASNCCDSMNIHLLKQAIIDRTLF